MCRLPAHCRVGLLLGLLALQSSGYFVIDEPAAQRQWKNDAPNLVSWSKGLLDGVDRFDVEMVRLRTDALVLVARNVPVKPARFNILIQDLPAGDDYFLIFLNTTHGVMYATSQRFSVLPPNASPSPPPSSSSSSSFNSPPPPPPPAPNVPTVTLSGAPHPTRQFATTFPALPNSAAAPGKSSPLLVATFRTNGVLFFFLFGALWTLLGVIA